jgi:hypothetical protein
MLIMDGFCGGLKSRQQTVLAADAARRRHMHDEADAEIMLRQ